MQHTCMNEMLYNWTFKFHKVVRQQNSGVVEDFVLPYSAVYLWIQKWKNYWNRSTFAKVIVKIKVAPFLWPTVYISQKRAYKVVEDSWLRLFQIRTSGFAVAVLRNLKLTIQNKQKILRLLLRQTMTAKLMVTTSILLYIICCIHHFTFYIPILCCYWLRDRKGIKLIISSGPAVLKSWSA